MCCTNILVLPSSSDNTATTNQPDSPSRSNNTTIPPSETMDIGFIALQFSGLVGWERRANKGGEKEIPEGTGGGREKGDFLFYFLFLPPFSHSCSDNCQPKKGGWGDCSGASPEVIFSPNLHSNIRAFKKCKTML